MYSVHPPPPFYWGFNPTKFSKREGGVLTGPQLLEGGCWERRGHFFQGGCNFYIKSEIFSDKKSLQTKIFFSVITTNSNWEILTKNLVTFKR